MTISRIAYSEHTGRQGEPFEYEVEIGELSMNELETLKRLLEKSGIIHPGIQQSPAMQADVSIGFRLTASGRIHTVQLQTAEVEGAVAELVEFLRSLVPADELIDYGYGGDIRNSA